MLPHPNKQTVTAKKPSVSVSFAAVFVLGFNCYTQLSLLSVATSTGEEKHHPPQVMAKIHFCAIRVFVEKAPESLRGRNFMARSSHEHFVSLTNTVYTGTMRSGNQVSAPKDKISNERQFQL